MLNKNKPGKERQIPHSSSYVEVKKLIPKKKRVEY
jgi:hypothetical protein